MQDGMEYCSRAEWPLMTYLQLKSTLPIYFKASSSMSQSIIQTLCLPNDFNTFFGQINFLAINKIDQCDEKIRIITSAQIRIKTEKKKLSLN
jgi:hypothetical protein